MAIDKQSGNGEQIQFNNFELNYTLQVIMTSNWLDIYLIIAAIYISYQLSYIKLKPQPQIRQARIILWLKIPVPCMD